MNYDLSRAARMAALAVLTLSLPAAAVEVMIPQAGMQMGLGAAAAPSVIAGAALPSLSAAFSAPALLAAPMAAPALSLSAAAPSAFAAAVAPVPALAAAPLAAASVGDQPAQPAAAASLHGLSDALAAGPKGGSGDEAAGAIARSFDNAGVKGKSAGIPMTWVDGMIAQGESADPQSRRLQDIVQRLGFSKAALNREILQDHNDKYTVEIPMGSITDQKQSGRCWLFAGLNMIRSTMIADKTVGKDFEFSENYLHFFNMLEKTNRDFEEASQKIYRRSSPKNFSSAQRRAAAIPQLGDGGWYEYFAFLVSKYGLVPKGAMGETISSGATAVMLNELKDSMAATTSEMLANAKQYKAGREPNLAQQIHDRGMSRVWKILVTHLGTPPSRFEYRDAGKTETVGRTQVTPTTVKTYTPQEYARDVVKFNPDDYLSVSAYPGKKENTVYEAKNSAIGKSAPGEHDRDLRFLNVNSDRLENLAADAIRGGQPVWFAADVGHNTDAETGIMHPRLFDRDAIYQFDAGESAPNLTRKQSAYFSRIAATHAMVLTGLDQPDPSKPIVKFKVENSWGDKVGSKGIFHLYREWFHQNVFVIVVHKRFLNEKEQGLVNGKSRELKGGLY
jgi:bleomycin hydrolase